MTVVNPKSISGINSITMASGSDNLLTIHTTNTTERVRVNSSGDVIVGSGITVSPDGDIFATGVTTSTTFVGALTGNVTGNISGGTVAGSTGTFTGDVSIADAIVHTGDNSKIRFPDNDRISFETGGTEIARFDNNQLFLVGATSAVNSSSAKVQVAHTDANARIDISRFSANDAPPYLEFHKSRSGTVGGNTIVNDGDEMGRIRWSGNNGTNTTAGAEIRSYVDGSPGSSSDMPGRIAFYTTPDSSGTPSERMRISSDGTKEFKNHGGGTIKVGGSSAHTSKIVIADNGGTANGNCLVEGGDGTDFFTITSGGNIAMANGKGIDFSAASGSASGSSNAILDDYEEGTWTPTYLFGSSDTSTYTNRSGSYTKIGNFVFAKFAVDISSRGSGSGRVDIGGLPFTIADKLSTTGQEVGGMISYFNGITFNVSMIGYWGQNGNDYVQLQYTSGAGNTVIQQYLQKSQIADNTGFRGYVIYNSS